MKLAIIADVHSNIHALEAVIERIESSDVEATICAGDIVGYGAFPNECCHVVRDSARVAIAGNHDISALTRDTTFMNPFAREAVLWSAERLETSAMKYLSSLDSEARFQEGGRRVAMFHGSPRDVSEYVYEPQAENQLLELAKCDILIMAHTHVPFAKHTRSGLILNPGSVGQPRDGVPQASFAILDMKEATASIVRVEYQVELAAEAIRKAKLPDVLADRLSKGL